MSAWIPVAFALFLGETPAPPTPGARIEVRLVSGSAEIQRRRVGAARIRATNQALREAVWQRTAGILASERRTEALRLRLGQNVRELIARYRTRKVQRQAQTLTVLLEVTVDETALTRRLAALGVRILAPGVLLLAHCDAGPLREPLVAAFVSAGIRPVTGPWHDLAVAAQVAAARARPEAAQARARQAETRAAVVASCHREPGRIVGPGVVAERLRVLVTLHAVGAATPILWQRDAAATALGPDSAAAAKEALSRALGRLSPGLVSALPRQLPPGPGRALRVQILGALPVPAILVLAGRLSRELPGVEEALPDRFARGEAWLRVITTLDLPGLRQALGRLTPPAGFLLSTQIVQPGGRLTLSARLAEESP